MRNAIRHARRPTSRSSSRAGPTHRDWRSRVRTRWRRSSSIRACFRERAAFDDALAGVIDRCLPDLIVLAGFMRVLGAVFVRRYEGRLINVHPSLLPVYPGLHTHRRALADGVRIHGCTVHFVTPEVDVGPIIAQGAVAVHPDDDEASLAARVLAVEHALLPAAVRWFCAGRLVIEGHRVRVKDMSPGHPAGSRS